MAIFQSIYNTHGLPSIPDTRASMFANVHVLILQYLLSNIHKYCVRDSSKVHQDSSIAQISNIQHNSELQHN